MSEYLRTLQDVGGDLARTVGRVHLGLSPWPEAREEWLRWGVHLRVTRGVSVRTCDRYLRAVGEFLQWLEPGPANGLDGVDRDTVDGWMESLYLERRLGAQTRQVLLVALRSFLAWRSLESGEPNPAADVRGPRKPKTEARKLTHRQVRKLIQATSGPGLTALRDRCLLVFLLSTGARPIEIRRLCLGDLDLRERMGRVRFRGKGAKERTVSFEGPAIKALLEWLQARDQLDLLEPDRLWTTVGKQAGRPITERGLDKALGRVAKRAKVAPFGLRMLRVTFATELYDSGSDIEEIRKLLGHESIETTRRYLAVSERMQKARIPGRRLRAIIGDERDVPLWLRHKMGNLESESNAEQ
ncbi:tyrosine-type recombinase/integrase [Natronospira bacteriovora]|uniref:Tyrosine-type recombinase/integrase n=1 Tax=Natronospira bacteriovora TaxID=3069753 RepID=A0ABU0W5R1_9GAMM|nr:tyrosine-type recombinase/integrase [Natronospira sp. AB-CW4]MDQ2069331.1 tyrosine-type recombinase/integrase [Natronospira sp. AB-CW4]